MLQPISKDNDLVCPGCGCVLGHPEPSNEHEEKSLIPPSIDISILGSALETNVRFSFRKTPQQVYEERVLKHLAGICKQYTLPERLAIETFKLLKKRRRGFRSESMPIKVLLEILGRDENYMHIHKMRAIKARYEDLLTN